MSLMCAWRLIKIEAGSTQKCKAVFPKPSQQYINEQSLWIRNRQFSNHHHLSRTVINWMKFLSQPMEMKYIHHFIAICQVHHQHQQQDRKMKLILLCICRTRHITHQQMGSIDMHARQMGKQKNELVMGMVGKQYWNRKIWLTPVLWPPLESLIGLGRNVFRAWQMYLYRCGMKFHFMTSAYQGSCLKRRITTGSEEKHLRHFIQSDDDELAFSLLNEESYHEEVRSLDPFRREGYVAKSTKLKVDFRDLRNVLMKSFTNFQQSVMGDKTMSMKKKLTMKMIEHMFFRLASLIYVEVMSAYTIYTAARRSLDWLSPPSSQRHSTRDMMAAWRQNCLHLCTGPANATRVWCELVKRYPHQFNCSIQKRGRRWTVWNVKSSRVMHTYIRPRRRGSFLNVYLWWTKTDGTHWEATSHPCSADPGSVTWHHG